jgi:hypothetical protein
LARVDAGVQAVDSGLRWAGSVGGASVVLAGLATLGALRSVAATRSQRRGMAGSLLAGGVTTPFTALLGVAAGARFGADVPFATITAEIAERGPILWPIAASSIAMAAAVLLTSLDGRGR